MPLNPQIARHREEILNLSERHGARNVRVFGSLARGEETEESDLDLLVEAGENTTPFFPGGLVADLQDLLGRPVEVLTEAALHRDLREPILSEAIPLGLTGEAV